MKTYSRFKKEIPEDTNVRRAYDALGPEFRGGCLAYQTSTSTLTLENDTTSARYRAIMHSMYNWSTDEKKIKAVGRAAYDRWRLEQMVNYGLRGKKVSARLLKKYWQKIFMDEPTRKYLSFLLWPGKKKF